jgi:hypothetical protein
LYLNTDDDAIRKWQKELSAYIYINGIHKNTKVWSPVLADD